ncbi:MAG: hypothetical protein WCK63_09500 [Betaproteobacteria bacterium]
MNRSLSARITLYFGGLFVVSVGGLLLLWYSGFQPLGIEGARNQLLAEAIRRVESVADSEHRFISNSLEERRGDILIIAENKLLSKKLRLLIDLFSRKSNGFLNVCSVPIPITTVS